MNRYTIHYRSTGYADETALIVTDAAGKAYLFSAGELQAACAGGDGRGATRLAALLRRRATWVPVTPAERYTLDHLRQFAGRPETCRATHPPRPTAPGGGNRHLNATKSGPPRGPVDDTPRPSMNYDDKLRDKLTTYVQDMYAVENQLVETLDKQVDQAAKIPTIQAKIREHLEATKQHHSRVEQRLKAYGEDLSALRGAMSGMMGNVTGAMSGMRSDVLVKNARDDLEMQRWLGQHANEVALLALEQDGITSRPTRAPRPSSRSCTARWAIWAPSPR